METDVTLFLIDDTFVPEKAKRFVAEAPLEELLLGAVEDPIFDLGWQPQPVKPFKTSEMGHGADGRVAILSSSDSASVDLYSEVLRAALTEYVDVIADCVELGDRGPLVEIDAELLVPGRLYALPWTGSDSDFLAQADDAFSAVLRVLPAVGRALGMVAAPALQVGVGESLEE
jgi:hypothetical protein